MDEGAMKNTEEKLLESWQANAEVWTTALREGKIVSREMVTHDAILNAIQSQSPGKMLDLGCGEGWLMRALTQAGWQCVGLEGASALVAQAQAASGCEILSLSYTAWAKKDNTRDFDLIVANFSLLEEELLPVLSAVKQVMLPGARLLIQTLHPSQVPGPYLNGWRSESFEGMGGGLWQKMPWYFRTLGAWLELLQAAGFTLQSLREPLHPESLQPASLLLEAVSKP
jgi:2-polyprenyl-3-methyl-5-hydroxy-6-metoxy-1,4-benzoquinol methylase